MHRKGFIVELRDYLRILHKNWILIVALALTGVAAGAASSLLTAPKYQSTTQLYVSVRANDTSGTSELVQGTTFARQAVVSYVDVVTSAIVLDRVVADLGLDLAGSSLAPRISASSPTNSVLINITATDEDPELVAAIANQTGLVFTDVVVNDLEASETGGSSRVQIKTIQPATIPGSPASPNVPLNLVLGLLLGLAAGVGIAVLRSTLDTRIHSQHDIEQITDAPLLGGIAFDTESPKRPLVVHADPRNPRAESFRSLRTNLQFINVEGGARSFVITSSVPSEGKSTTAANLAIAIAETGASVAVIDGDLRRPKLADYLGIEGAVGLTDVLIGRAKLDDVLQQWGRGKLFVLSAGRIPPNPSELLGSSAMQRVLGTLGEHFDYVLIDAPPLLLVTDAAVVSKLASGAILVAASGSTKRQELAGAVRALEAVGSRLLGVVVTMLPTKGPDSYAYGAYTYAYYSGKTYVAESESQTDQLRVLDRFSDDPLQRSA